MSENEGVRIASLLVGMLLCMALTQTGCAAWNVANWNLNAGNSTVLNTTIENKTVESTTRSSTDGPLPSSDLINNPVQSDNLVNYPNLSNLLSGSISQNGIQFPKIQRR
jgi:hypothetical protein